LRRFFYQVAFPNSFLIAATLLDTYKIEDHPIYAKENNVVLEGRMRVSDGKHVAIKICEHTRAQTELLVLETLRGEHHIVGLVEHISLPNDLHAIVLDYHNPTPFCPKTSKEVLSYANQLLEVSVCFCVCLVIECLSVCRL
jgi:hypothetical protein